MSWIFLQGLFISPLSLLESRDGIGAIEQRAPIHDQIPSIGISHPFSLDPTAYIFQELNVELPRYSADNRVFSFPGD